MYRFLERNTQLQNDSRDCTCPMELYRDARTRLLSARGALRNFHNADAYFGIHHLDYGWVYREWAPDARQLYLAGEFNGWRWEENPMLHLGNGCWMLFLPGDKSLWEGCKVQTVVETDTDRKAYVPLFAEKIVPHPDADSWCAEVADDRKPSAPEQAD